MVEEKLSMEDVMRQMDSLKQKETSKVIKGTVIEVDSAAGKVLVDIGYKSEGIISLEEFSDKEVNIGDEIDVFIVKKSRDFESPPILSHKRAELEQQWDKLQDAKTNDFVLDVRIEKKVKGGLIVDINGIMAFMPASLAGYPMVKNLDSILGNTVPCKVIEFDRDKRNVVVSWRKAIEEDVLRKREELFEQLYPGKMVKGVISGIKSFGAFVDIGGLDGLLHISELSWGHVDKVEDILKIGQEVEVKIKSFNPNSNKVSLSLKETQPHPWENIDSKYVVDNIVKGKVTGIANYGAFVELSPGIEGLVKTEELSWTNNVKHAGDVLKVQDMVEVKILALDEENQRMALSLKQAKQNPWEEVEANYQQGNIIEGSITHITDFGAFMMLKEGVEGLIHISDMSWTSNIKHPDEVVKVGDTVKVKIMSIEPDKQKISLGLKQVEENPYADYPVGSIIDDAKITKVSATGAYLELKNSLSAFLHISNYSKERTDDLQKHLTEGETLKCKVIKNNPAKKYIEVSIKDYIKDKEKADTQKYIQPSGTTGGATIYDLIGDKLDGIAEEKE